MGNNSPLASAGSKTSEALNDIRNKRSLKLLEDCIEKLVKSAHASPASEHLNNENRKKLLAKFGPFGQTTNWLELQNCMSKFIQASTGSSATATGTSSTKPVDENSFKFSFAAKSVHSASHRPLRNAIKLVSNATIVLTCRELLILFINWSLRQQQKKASRKVCLSNSRDLATTSSGGSSNKKLSIMQINCETEFELLQLLDILYYTDNSINYKLFIKNLIMSLNLTQQSERSDEAQCLSVSQTKVLSRICMMACEFMLPEFKLVRKVNWSSDEKSGFVDNDTGERCFFLENYFSVKINSSSR